MIKFTPDQLNALADLYAALMAHFPAWYAARQAAGADLTSLPVPRQAAAVTDGGERAKHLISPQ
jgi:hypothetical protein